MVFSSLLFVLVFLPANLFFYFLVDSVKAKNAVLLVFSLVFYAWGEPVYVLILIGMSFFCWLFSRLLERAEGRAGARKLLMFLSAAVCIGAIGFFKYAGFLAENVNRLAGTALLPVPALSLPIGISFYTFQLLTYVADVYRGEVPAQRSYWRVLLYAGLFHQCVAGPIVRYGDIENELTSRRTDLAEASRGATRFLCGLAKKAVLANGCGAAVDALLLSDAAISDASALAGNVALLSGRSALTLWAGMAFYMLQIYLDFSAYSDMAIGMGLICGLHYKENFNYPYISGSVTEFWRRWHISLGTFFRDYVYIPLGGNRKGKVRQIFNLFVVWALTGLWHGASWNFVFWGLYYGLFLLFEKYVMNKVLDRLPGFVRTLYTLVIVAIGWVFFSQTDMGEAFTYIGNMFGAAGGGFANSATLYFLKGNVILLIIGALVCRPAPVEFFRKKTKKHPTICIILLAVMFVLCIAFLVYDSYNPFLYFRFS